jgi:hypothetical protein
VLENETQELIRLTLYTGPECHLCNLARDLIFQTLEYGSYELEEVDVTQSLDTKKAYGLRIPVLVHEGKNQELPWPFNEVDLQLLVE